MTKDPVCRMTVEERKPGATAGYKGSTYYFCSLACKETFAKNPEKYAGGAQHGKHGCA